MYNEKNQQMKDEFEAPVDYVLEKKIPVLIRVDGKAFHTFTKGFKRPFDDILRNSMKNTMLRLCLDIQGCVFGYEQSDEITLVLIDYQNPTSSAWFDYRIQKVASTAAGLATCFFNQELAKNINAFVNGRKESEMTSEELKYLERIRRAQEKGAVFDGRCFNVPQDMVFDRIMGRQIDAIKNSISVTGQTYFSQNELNKKSTKEIVEMLKEKNIMWEEFPVEHQRGAACYKTPQTIVGPSGTKVTRNKFQIDDQMPVLMADGSNRDYIDKFLKGEDSRCQT